MDGVGPPSGTIQPDCRSREVYGPAAILTRDREVPLSEERMVLYATPPKTISPDDPCNKVALSRRVARLGRRRNA
jgi:hypothetical protein